MATELVNYVKLSIFKYKRFLPKGRISVTTDQKSKFSEDT